MHRIKSGIASIAVLAGCVPPTAQIRILLDDNELRVNADFDERNGGGKIEDYRRPAHILPQDPDLLHGALAIVLDDDRAEGRWKLDFSGDRIGVWACVEDNSSEDDCMWQRVVPGSLAVEPARSGQSIRLRIEGLSGSLHSGDASIRPTLVPIEGDALSGPAADLTVIETQFMLSFDDGPYTEAERQPPPPERPKQDTPPQATQKLLDALADIWIDGEPAKAAFCVVGTDGSGRLPTDPIVATEGIHDSQHRALLHRASAAGHTVVSHTNTHRFFAPVFGDPQQVKDEILRAESQIQTAIPNPPRWLRPPYMQSGSIFDRGYVVESAEQVGYAILWGHTYGDWKIRSSTDDIIQRVWRHMEAWNTPEHPARRRYPNIIVFHDASHVTPQHLTEIIAALRDAGLVLVQFDLERTRPKRSDYDQTVSGGTDQ